MLTAALNYMMIDEPSYFKNMIESHLCFVIHYIMRSDGELS